jgi:hypothetical protein
VGVVEKVFAAWYRYRNGQRNRGRLQAEIAPLRADAGLWERGTTFSSWMARAFCNDVCTMEPALWMFAAVEEIEPTNNAAERALRPAVLRRKCCFGADGTEGNQFVARILTVATTCRQQQRHLLDYLADAVAAHRLAQSASALLPTS